MKKPSANLFYMLDTTTFAFLIRLIIGKTVSITTPPVLKTHLNTFDTKIISRTLPTGEVLAKRHGGAFTYLNCAIYDTCQETFEHLWNCPLNDNNIDYTIVCAVSDTIDQF